MVTHGTWQIIERLKHVYRLKWGFYIYIGRIWIEVKCKVKHADTSGCSVKQLHNRI
jgi:hypothetical protein